MRYKGGRFHTAKIKSHRYDINVSKNETSDGIYTTTVGNKTYKMKALKDASLKSMVRVPSAVPLAVPSVEPSPVNVPMNQQLTPEQAAQKGINSMLKKQQQGFQRHNNDNATRSAAEKALQYSQARNDQQADDDSHRNIYEEMARNKAQSNATMSSQLRNKKQANNQASRNEQNTALKAEAASSAQISSNEWHKQETKRQKEENSALLPKKPSNMTPMQIAGQLERDLQQLEGPIYASVLVPKPELERILGRKPPVFMLLGDNHSGIEKCESCVQPGCYSLYKNKGKTDNRSTFLDYLDNQTKKNWIIDVFFEKWHGPQFRKSSKKSHERNSRWGDYDPNTREESHRRGAQTSPLLDWDWILRPCIGYIQQPISYTNNNISRCDYTHFRIHEGNVRDAGDQKFETILRKLCSHILRFKGEYFDNFKDSLQSDVMQHMTLKESIDFIILIASEKFTIKSAIEHPAYKDSRTVHELNQLPRELYDGIVNNPKLGYVFGDTNNDEILKKFRPHIQFLCISLNKILEDKTELGKSVTLSELHESAEAAKLFTDNTGVLNLNSSLVDLYTVARALKPFKQGYETSLYSQLAVSYFGAAHIDRAGALLKQWYTPHVSWGTRSINLLVNQVYSDPKKPIIKCIKQIKNDSDDLMYQSINRLYGLFYSSVNNTVDRIAKRQPWDKFKEEDTAIYIKAAEILKNENAARAAFDPEESLLAEKSYYFTDPLITTLIPLLKNFIKRYEEANPQKASNANGGRRTRKNRSKRTRRMKR